LVEEYKDVKFLQNATKSSDSSTTKASDMLTAIGRQNANIDQNDCEVSPSAVTLSRIAIHKPQSTGCE